MDNRMKILNDVEWLSEEIISRLEMNNCIVSGNRQEARLLVELLLDKVLPDEDDLNEWKNKGE